jgi:ABC-type transporter Mla subunit MlaD
MTTDERIDAIAKTLEQLAGVTSALAGSVAAHDRQIGTLITATAELKATVAATSASVSELTREWQAYLRRIPRQ